MNQTTAILATVIDDTASALGRAQPPAGDPKSTPVPSEAFVRAMRGRATGVNIVTTAGGAGRFGITVSAFASVSAEPPLVLVCINRRSPACAAIAANGCFCANVLSVGQQHLAEIFAGQDRHGQPYDFSAARWTKRVTGAPGLTGAIGSFDCELAGTIDAGTHRIFLGRVVAVAQAAGQPLLYGNRGYRRSCH